MFKKFNPDKHIKNAEERSKVLNIKNELLKAVRNGTVKTIDDIGHVLDKLEAKSI